MTPLRSGQPLTDQWRDVNAISRSAGFSRQEVINALLQLSGGNRHRLIGGGGTSSVFMGEYDPLANYSFLNEVIISMGANTGTYVCVNNAGVTGVSPALGGVNWVQKPGNPYGVWL